MQGNNTTPTPLVPPTLPEAPPDPKRVTIGHGISGCALTTGTAVLVGGLTALTLVSYAHGGITAMFGGTLCGLALLLVWFVAGVVMAAAGRAARLPWTTTLLPLGSFALFLGVLCLWNHLASQVSWSVDSLQRGLGIFASCYVGGLAVWLVIAGVRHLMVATRK